MDLSHLPLIARQTWLQREKNVEDAKASHRRAKRQRDQNSNRQLQDQFDAREAEALKLYEMAIESRDLYQRAWAYYSQSASWIFWIFYSNVYLIWTWLHPWKWAHYKFAFCAPIVPTFCSEYMTIYVSMYSIFLFLCLNSASSLAVSYQCFYKIFNPVWSYFEDIKGVSADNAFKSVRPCQCWLHLQHNGGFGCLPDFVSQINQIFSEIGHIWSAHEPKRNPYTSVKLETTLFPTIK